MSYYAKIKPVLVEAKNGAELDAGATISCTITGKTITTPKLSVGEFTTVTIPDDSTILSLTATPSSAYALKAINSEVYECFDNEYVIFSASTSSTSPLSDIDLSELAQSAQSEDTAIEVVIYIYLSSKTKTLTYNANGGENPPPQQTFTAGVPFRLNNDSNIPTLDSNPNSFYRWNVAGTSTVYAKGATVTFDDDITLYAMWSNTDFTPEKYEGSLVYKV